MRREGPSKVCLLASCLWEALMEDRKRWNRSLLHPLNYLKPSLSLEHGAGASLPLVRVGWLRTDFRRVLAGTHSVQRRSLPILASMIRSQAGRVLLTMSMEGALCGRSQPPAISAPHRVFRKKGGKSSILLETLPNERRRDKTPLQICSILYD